MLPQSEVDDFSERLEADHTPLWEHWEAFISKSLMLGKRASTLKGARDTLRFIIRHTGIVSIEEMNRPGVFDDQLIRLQFERGFSLNTRKTYIKNLNTYFIWLYRNHLIEVNNVGRIERGRERAKEMPPLEKAQINQVLAHLATRRCSGALERVRNQLMVDILRFSGIRPCELLDLTTGAIYRDKSRWVLAVEGRKQHARVSTTDLYIERNCSLTANASAAMAALCLD